MTDQTGLVEQAKAHVGAGDFEPALHCYAHLLEEKLQRMDIAVRAGDIEAAKILHEFLSASASRVHLNYPRGEVGREPANPSPASR